jgi:hypothetical protein
MTPLVQAPPDRLRYLLDLQRRAAKIKPGVARYYHDPLAFAADCIDFRGDGLTGYQEEVIGGLPQRKRTAVRGPHGLGLGKSAISAITVLWFALTRDASGTDWKVATTAGSWHQLTQYLWPEIHKWSGRLRWDKVRDGRPFTRAELQNLNLRLGYGHAFAGASANAALIEGAHADSLLFVYDESKAIPAGTFDACEGAFSGSGEGGTEAYALALSTPGAPQGRFYDICRHAPGYEDWHPVHVTLEQAMAAGRITGEWAAQRARQWGEASAIYVNRVLGEFHAGDEDSVIPLAWAEAAVARWHEWEAKGKPDPGRPRVVGVDVARSGEDRTVLAIRKGPVITELRRSVKEDTMQTTGRVKALLEHDDSVTAVVDVIGIGAGVVDRLRELHMKVLAFNAAKASKVLDSTREFGFSNRRAEAWWTLRQALDPSGDPDICLPDDEMLLGDLSAPKWIVTSGGRIQVELKEEIKKRIGRSTDDGDACFVAGTMIATESGQVPVELVRPGMRVWTRGGLRPVLAAAMTGKSAEVMRVELQDGRSLTGTPNHPVWDGNAFRRLDAFVQDDRMWMCEPSGSHTAESFSRAIPTVLGGSTGSITGQARRGATAAPGRFTSRSTRPRSARFLTAGTSTTRTRTRSTTVLATLRRFRLVSTPPSTSPLTGAGARLTWRTWTACANSPRSGTVPLKAARGTPSTAGRAGSAARLLTSALVLNAVSRSRARWARAGTGSAGAAARAGRAPQSGRSATGTMWSALSAGVPSGSGRARVTDRENLRLAPVSVVRSCAAGERPVWNLQVAGKPEYFANGILVHNCVMAFVPHLGDGTPGAVRRWAGAVELDSMGASGETKAHKRMREIAGKAAEGLEDAPWDLDGFSPGDDEQERPARGNVRSWR